MGFGAHSTAEEVTEGTDLRGQTWLVTGVSSGLGHESARVLGLRGARVIGAARTADDRRRITSVLAAAPVAALWGPSPVPRAGGRCLDVMRLSRITADSPAVEATSVRCQAVLEGMRGRFDTARSLLDSARATGRKVGLRHFFHKSLNRNRKNSWHLIENCVSYRLI